MFKKFTYEYLLQSILKPLQTKVLHINHRNHENTILVNALPMSILPKDV